jgi:hypothetical protein
MNRAFSLALALGALILLSGTRGFCGTFDERLWEKYAEINIPANEITGNLVALDLAPHHLGDTTAQPPFADLRVVTDAKEEVPWQIVEKTPRTTYEEIPHRMQNLSLTDKGETWLELLLERQEVQVNAIEVVTSDTNFSRQVQVLGSADGKTWNLVRGDGVVFDITRMEKIRHTRINFPQMNFQYFALKINNSGAQPLDISDVKVLQQGVEPEQTYVIYGKIENSENNPKLKENSIIVRMNTAFPVDRLIINTTERNFQRSVAVQVRRDEGDWRHWAQGTIFSFDTATMHEAQLTIDIPTVSAKEFRLVFKNFDSQPLLIRQITGQGYKRSLVFKHQADKKMYLFWGNPLAKEPRYDLSGVLSRQNLDLPTAYLGQAYPNSKFAGNSARLPFTERYKYLLYILVLLGIAGLIFLQYRVFRRMKS